MGESNNIEPKNSAGQKKPIFIPKGIEAVKIV